FRAPARPCGRPTGSSSLDDPERAQLGHSPSQTGALDDAYDTLHVLVGERRLLGQAPIGRTAHDDPLGLELASELGAAALAPGPGPAQATTGAMTGGTK